MNMIRNIPYSYVPVGFVELGIHVHIWSPHLLQGKFPDFIVCPRDRLLEAHSVDEHANAVFSGHHLADGRILLLTSLLCRSHSAGPKLERKSARDCGKESCLAWI